MVELACLPPSNGRKVAEHMIAEQAMRAAETAAVRAASPLPTNVSSEVRLSRLEDKVDQILTELKRARVTPLT